VLWPACLGCWFYYLHLPLTNILPRLAFNGDPFVSASQVTGLTNGQNLKIIDWIFLLDITVLDSLAKWSEIQVLCCLTIICVQPILVKCLWWVRHILCPVLTWFSFQNNMFAFAYPHFTVEYMLARDFIPCAEYKASKWQRQPQDWSVWTLELLPTHAVFIKVSLF
jgi:hypothetical protein